MLSTNPRTRTSIDGNLTQYKKYISYSKRMTQKLYCYICSAARSGSTLTDMLLGGHPDAASLGELNFIGKAIAIGEHCSCGHTVSECPEWNKIFLNIQSTRGIDFLEHPYEYRLWDARAAVKQDFNHQTRSFLAAVKVRGAYYDACNLLSTKLRNLLPLPATYNEAIQNKIQLYDTILKSWDKRVIIDSSKNIREAIELYLTAPDRVRIVLLTRDGRGVYCSERTSGFSQAQSLSTWKRYYQRALWLVDKKLPSKSVLRLKYEYLASNPESAARVLCNYLNIDFLPQMLELAAHTRHLVNGNDTRFRANRPIKLDERWRRDLKGEDLSYFSNHDNGLNKRLGYTD